MNMVAGTRLKNGAVVIAYKEAGDKRVVVADFGANHLSVTPYVTWRVDEGGNTFSGHYHATQAEAFRDFVDR